MLQKVAGVDKIIYYKNFKFKKHLRTNIVICKTCFPDGNVLHTK